MFQPETPATTSLRRRFTDFEIMELEIFLPESLLLSLFLPRELRILFGLGKVKMRHIPNVPTLLFLNRSRRYYLRYSLILRLSSLRVCRRRLFVLRRSTKSTRLEIKVAKDCPTLVILLRLLLLPKLAFYPIVFRKHPEPYGQGFKPKTVTPRNELGAASDKVSKDTFKLIIPYSPCIISFARYQKGSKGHTALYLRCCRLGNIFAS